MGTITFNATRELNTLVQPSQSYAVFRYTSGVLSSNLGALNSFDYFTDTASVGDRLYIGVPCPCKEIIFNVGTARNGSVTYKWEFWNGTAWTLFTPVSDGTNFFSTVGVNTLVLPIDSMENWWGSDNNRSPEIPAAYGFLIRAVILTVSGLTEGGAQATDLVKYKDYTILVDGFTSGSPATLETIYNADIAGGWGVVTKNGTVYTINANLHHSPTGFLLDSSKTLIIGSFVSKRCWTSQAGCTVTFGSFYSGPPNDMVATPCEIIFNNAYAAYNYFQGDLVMYGGSYRTTATQGPWFSGTGTKFIDCNVTIYQGVVGGTVTLRRVTLISGDKIYFFTTPASEYTDVTFSRVQLSIDPGFHPKFTGSNMVTNANWRGGYVGSAGSVSYAAFDLINCTVTDPTKWSVGSANNTSYRTENFFAASLDMCVSDQSGAPVQGAVIEISNKQAVVTAVDSGTTLVNSTNGHIDRLAWGTTSFTVVDGSKFAVDDYIRIDFEVMKVVGISTNVLTVTRAQFGTFIGKHNMDNALLKIFKIVPVVVSNAGGTIPTQLAVYHNRFYFGTATPSPYNNGSLSVEDYNPFTFKIAKYGYVLQSIAKTVAVKDFTSVVLVTSPFIVAPESTAAAYTGITIDGAAKTIIMTANHTMQELYDYSQWWACQSGNMQHAEPIATADGSSYASTYSLTIDGCALSGSGRLNLGGNTLTLSSGGSSSVTITAADGTHTTIQLTGLVSGSRVQLYDLTAATEIHNAVVNAAALTVPAIWTADHTIRVRVMYVSGTQAKRWYEASGTLTANGMSLNVAQEDDQVYNTIAIDGSTVTECSISGTNLIIDVSDPDNTTTAQRLYAFEVYWLGTEGGIRDQALYIEATDSTHMVFEGGLKIKNSNSSPLQITGGNIVPVSGPATDVMDTSGGPIFLNFNRVEGFAYMTQGGLTTAEHDKLFSVADDVVKRTRSNIIALK